MNILGYNYSLDLDKSADEIGTMGRCNSRTLVIQVANDIAAQQIESTVLHEILEAIDTHLQLKLEHPQICALEVALYQALTDNGVSLGVMVAKAA